MQNPISAAEALRAELLTLRAEVVALIVREKAASTAKRSAIFPTDCDGCAP